MLQSAAEGGLQFYEIGEDEGIQTGIAHLVADGVHDLRKGFHIGFAGSGIYRIPEGAHRDIPALLEFPRR